MKFLKKSFAAVVACCAIVGSMSITASAACLHDGLLGVRRTGTATHYNSSHTFYQYGTDGQRYPRECSTSVTIYNCETYCRKCQQRVGTAPNQTDTTHQNRECPYYGSVVTTDIGDKIS